MKTIVAIAALIAGSAFAGKTISEEPSILTTQGVDVKVSKLCVNGDVVETKVAYEYCTKSEKVWIQDNGSRRRSDGHFEYECVETEVGKLSHPINYTKATCHREMLRDNGGDKYLGPCKYTYAPATLELSYTFPVYKITGRRTDVDLFTGEAVRKIGNKTVNIPACN